MDNYPAKEEWYQLDQSITYFPKEDDEKDFILVTIEWEEGIEQIICKR